MATALASAVSHTPTASAGPGPTGSKGAAGKTASAPPAAHTFVPVPGASSSNSSASLLSDQALFATTVAACRRSVRMGFLRKVYAILSVQLLVTTMVAATFMAVPSIKTFVQNSPNLIMIGYFAGLALVFALMANRQNFPMNMYLLGAFTLVESYLVGTIVTFYDVPVVLEAFVITLTVTLGLTLYTFQTKVDFTGLAPVLLSALWIMIFAGFFQAFFPLSQGMDLVYSLAGCLLFSLFIIVDTQMMLHRLSTDEYILCAINLYLDIINLFIKILRVLNSRK